MRTLYYPHNFPVNLKLFKIKKKKKTCLMKIFNLIISGSFFTYFTDKCFVFF